MVSVAIWKHITEARNVKSEGGSKWKHERKRGKCEGRQRVSERE